MKGLVVLFCDPYLFLQARLHSCLIFFLCQVQMSAYLCLHRFLFYFDISCYLCHMFSFTPWRTDPQLLRLAIGIELFFLKSRIAIRLGGLKKRKFRHLITVSVP